ncbi:MAG: pilus assembly protein TadG-related protein [Candidatus Sulfotelmatobacter sp.]
MVLVALAMVAIIAMAALSIDVVTLYLARMEAQRSADAAALAAARVISLSGMTGDPGNSSSSWTAICGGPGSPASQAGQAAATQNLIGAIAPTVTINYYAAGASATSDCSGMPAAFGVNPLVTAQVTRANLPTFFSRIWGRSGNTVSATATAEAFNSSNSANISNGPTGTITPVQPRCVKPWMVPNQDPLYLQPTRGNYCNQSGGPGACTSLVDVSSGQIQHPGISLNGTGANGVIGETFWLSPDCTHTGGGCTFRTQRPQIQPYANFTGNSYVPNPPNLLYVPGQAPTVTPVAVPSCSSGQDLYQQAVAGCDQSTVYQCGVQNMNTVALSQNPDSDTSQGIQCLIDEGDPNTSQPDGQDTINTSSYPFQVLAGTSNLLIGSGVTTGTPMTSSSSIVSLPIYDSTQNINTSGNTQVTVVGFLQVFINQVDQWGTMSVTVLNVTGCGNGQGQPVGTAVAGSSPVPVRLITAP